ncbi:Fe2+-dependent dioxygenase [Egbenema bharatensis]|uniref:Fe2+-dependent dioxygenase n=1 Tax=Egbenema bharatensis TaxID=3463334 RepID=UPI003A86A00F
MPRSSLQTPDASSDSTPSRSRHDSSHEMLQQAIQLGQRGHWAEAIQHCRQLMAQMPDHVQGHHFLGFALLQRSEHSEAIAHLQRAIDLDPTQAEIYSHLGLAYCQAGQLEAGISAYQQALMLEPEALDIRYNRAIGLQKLEQWQEAAQEFLHLLAQEPHCIAAYYQLGNVSQKQQDFNTALSYYRKALELSDRAEVAAVPLNRLFAVRLEAIWYNLAVALQELGETQPALQACQQALQIQPQYSEAHNAIGTLLEKQGRREEAIFHFQQALQRMPDYIPLLSNWGNLQTQQRQWQTAEAAFRRILQLNPQHLKALNGLLKVLLQTAQWTDLAELTEKLWQIGQHQICTDIVPYDVLSLKLSAAQQQVLAENHAKAVAQKIAPLRQQLNFLFPPRHPDRLRIGYVSGDFRNQAIAHLIYRLFELHDRQQVEVFAYSLGKNDNSPYRHKLEADCDCFQDVQGWSDQAIAQQVYNDQIDILIDLEGYTEYAQTSIYALRPAPLIVSYLGHSGTMGADYIDYFITDEVATPPEQATHLTEQCIYLPHSHIVTNNQEVIAPTVFQRSDFGLPDAAFVFCAFHKNAKIEPHTFAVWMRILKNVPDSVLWLKINDPIAQQNLIAHAERSGISGDRLIFTSSFPKAEYLVQLQCADLYLDALQFNACVTAVDSLWAGLPLLTCAGEAFASRMAASCLSAVGLPELITTSPEAYEQQAIYLATHPDELQALRQRLVQARSNAPLFNTEQTVRHLESAYQMIWQNYQAGLNHQPIYVPTLPASSPVSSSPSSASPPSSPPHSSASNASNPLSTNLIALPAGFCLHQVLTQEELNYITSKLRIAEFEDGKLTAGKYAQPVKHNLQLKDSPIATELRQMVVTALTRNSLFQGVACPKMIRSPLFSRTEVGMHYGTHIDNALMGNQFFRSDLSLTLFLSDPDSYDGGELVIETHQGSYPVKLEAGSAIVYPSTTLHQVTPVTRGVRLVACTWVQSLIRDPGDREILMDLEIASQALFEQTGKTKAFDLVLKAHANLMRKWVEM